MRNYSEAPIAADFFITRACNQHCAYCCYRPFQENCRRDLTTGEWLAIIDELAEIPIFQVGILAGEPLMRGDILEICRHLVKRRIRFALNTNGTLLTEDHLKFLAGCKLVDQVQVSLDAGKSRHDAVRGPGSWQAAVKAALRLKEYGVPLKINMVVTAGTFQYAAEACEWICDTIKPKILYVSAVTDGAYDLPDEHRKLSEAECAEMIRQLLELKEKHPELQSTFLKLYREISQPRKFTETAVRHCGSLFRRLTICADGRITACPNDVAGNLGYAGTDRILEVWQHNVQRKNLLNRALAGDQLPTAECAGCQYAAYCRQCCPVHIGERRVLCRKKIADYLQND